MLLAVEGFSDDDAGYADDDAGYENSDIPTYEDHQGGSVPQLLRVDPTLQ